VNLTKSSVDSLTQSFSNDNNENGDEKFSPKKAASAPGVYMGQFNANIIQDTFFDSTGWDKGQLFINGYNIGRYWPTRGPQVNFYEKNLKLLFLDNFVRAVTIYSIQKHGLVNRVKWLATNFIDHSIFNYS